MVLIQFLYPLIIFIYLIIQIILYLYFFIENSKRKKIGRKGNRYKLIKVSENNIFELSYYYKILELNDF